MKQELIYNILPIKAYEIELKCFYASHFILGRIFALWNKKKKAIKVSKDYFLKIKHLKKPALWVILKELQDKNIITVTRINNNNNVMIIDFTDDFIKNYVNAEVEAEAEVEDTEEFDNEDIEEQEIDYSGTEQEEDYQELEILEKASKFDYSKLKSSDFSSNNFITNDGIFCDRTYINDNNTEFELYPLFLNDDNSPMTIKQLIELKKKGDLDLETWKDFKKYFLPEWEHLKSKGLV